MESMIEFVHQRIKKHKYQNGIDFTMGNGHDTLFLSDYCHHVYSYDIQSLALNNTKELVKRKKNITLFLKSHEYFDDQGKESTNLDAYFRTLDHKLYNVAKFEMMNKNNSPYVVIIEKR